MGNDLLTMPLIPLRGLTVLPKMSVHFDISRKKSVAAVEKAMVGDQRIYLVTQKDPGDMEPGIEQLFKIGTICTIKQLVKMPGGIVRVTVDGICKAELLALDFAGPTLVGEVSMVEDEEEELDFITKEAMVRVLREQLEKLGNEQPKFKKDLLPGLLLYSDLETLLEQMAIQMPWEPEIRQEILDTVYLTYRYEVMIKHLIREIQLAQVKREIQNQVKVSIDKNQRDYILREQMKFIREELGEDNSLTEADEYRKQTQALKADKEVKDKILKEIDRFQNIPGGAQEANVLRTYIETLLELPWKKTSKDNNDLKHAQEILEAEHYGLEQVKERVLESLAVRILTKQAGGSILCLVGPPGTGKTSIARSVAHAMNKKYVRISLGGVRDEAEIRGHRKTYVGAMPGRLVEGLKQAGVANPLMLLDEIDKVSNDYKGDTFSALLEVLDSEQNVHFRDHYVELPMDLSQVLFIATANTTQTIPKPLLDRMEVIEINSYTENEKFHIARNYLIEKQKKRNGLKEDQLTIPDATLKKVIHNYTREAGVRNLERRIGDICRKVAREVLEKKKSEVKVTERNLERYLGKEKIIFESANEEDQVGIVRGLAWTSVGGDTLQVEVNVMPGKGVLKLTGKMGDVMKESAQTALTYVRSVCPGYRVADDYFEKHDIHVHIPEGAVPKDGPSAGITMATAMLSAVTETKVSAGVAMTGEITLRGRVLPIGGLKEKILAAKMADIKTVLVPDKNRPDIAELSAEITKGLSIVFVQEMGEVIKQAFA